MSRKLESILADLQHYDFTETNDNCPFEDSNKAKYTDDYTARCIKRTKLTNCDFQDAKFDYAAVTGSLFENCIFTKCSMLEADFEFCNFEYCSFKSNPSVGVSFNNSTFYNTKFCDSPFTTCTLTGALFKDVLFSNSKIQHSTLENTIFENCTFKDMDLSNLNMEYIELKDVVMENVILPFSQIPYIFGGVEYIKKTSDNVFISSGSDSISTNEYLANGLKLLCEYYEAKKIHFPLANIYLALEKRQEAFRHLSIGLRQCVMAKDFRMIKYYCKLAVINNVFSYNELNTLYKIIHKYLPQTSLNGQQLHNYSKHISEIKEILFKRQDMPRMSFSFRTNIEPENFQVLSSLLEDIFKFKSKICSIDSTTELLLDQNSPFLVTLDITDQLQNLCQLAAILINLINESNELYKIYYEAAYQNIKIEENCFEKNMETLLALSDLKKINYTNSNVYFSVEEILFSNIRNETYDYLQYFNLNRSKNIALLGE